MSKKMKPSLKDYLKTGKRSASEPSLDPLAAEAEKAEKNNGQGSGLLSFLDLLSPKDMVMWKSMIDAGITVRLRGLDAEAARENFQAMDRTRFTCYALAEKGAPLRPVKEPSQIREPLALLLTWDEMGVLTVYGPDLSH